LDRFAIEIDDSTSSLLLHNISITLSAISDLINFLSINLVGSATSKLRERRESSSSNRIRFLLGDRHLRHFARRARSIIKCIARGKLVSCGLILVEARRTVWPL